MDFRVKENLILRCIFSYLKDRGFYDSLLAFSRETGIFDEDLDVPDLRYTQELALSGRWDDLIAFLDPVGKSFDKVAKSLHYIIRRQQFLEALSVQGAGGQNAALPAWRPGEKMEEDLNVDVMTQLLRSLHDLCPPKEFESICRCLTLERLTDNPDYADWTVSQGRLYCFQELKSLLKPIFIDDRSPSSKSASAYQSSKIPAFSRKSNRSEPYAVGNCGLLSLFAMALTFQRQQHHMAAEDVKNEEVVWDGFMLSFANQAQLPPTLIPRLVLLDPVTTKTTELIGEVNDTKLAMKRLISSSLEEKSNTDRPSFSQDHVFLTAARELHEAQYSAAGGLAVDSKPQETTTPSVQPSVRINDKSRLSWDRLIKGSREFPAKKPAPLAWVVDPSVLTGVVKDTNASPRFASAASTAAATSAGPKQKSQNDVHEQPDKVVLAKQPLVHHDDDEKYDPEFEALHRELLALPIRAGVAPALGLALNAVRSPAPSPARPAKRHSSKLSSPSQSPGGKMKGGYNSSNSGSSKSSPRAADTGPGSGSGVKGLSPTRNAALREQAVALARQKVDAKFSAAAAAAVGGGEAVERPALRHTKTAEAQAKSSVGGVVDIQDKEDSGETKDTLQNGRKCEIAEASPRVAYATDGSALLSQSDAMPQSHNEILRSQVNAAAGLPSASPSVVDVVIDIKTSLLFKAACPLRTCVHIADLRDPYVVMQPTSNEISAAVPGLAIGSNDKCIYVIPSESVNDPHASFSNIHKGSVYCVDWLSSRRILASSSNDKSIRLTSLDRGDGLTLKGHNGTVRTVKFQPSTQFRGLLASAGAGDFKPRIWDCTTGSIATELTAHPGAVHALQWIDESIVITGCEKGHIILHDLRTAAPAGHFSLDALHGSLTNAGVCCLHACSSIEGAIFGGSAAGVTIVAGCTAGIVSAVSVWDQRILEAETLHSDDIHALSMVPTSGSLLGENNGDSLSRYCLLTTSYDSTAAMWSVNGWSPKSRSASQAPGDVRGAFNRVARFSGPGHTDKILSLSYVHDDLLLARQVITTGADGRVLRWSW